MNVTIAYALRWGVASVGIFSTRRGSPFMRKIFQVQGRHWWMMLIRVRNCTASRHMAFIILFVKSIE